MSSGPGPPTRRSGGAPTTVTPTSRSRDTGRPGHHRRRGSIDRRRGPLRRSRRRGHRDDGVFPPGLARRARLGRSPRRRRHAHAAGRSRPGWPPTLGTSRRSKSPPGPPTGNGADRTPVQPGGRRRRVPRDHRRRSRRERRRTRAGSRAQGDRTDGHRTDGGRPRRGEHRRLRPSTRNFGGGPTRRSGRTSG